MSLLVYEKPTELAFLSTDGTFTNPFSMSIDGRTGGTLDFQLFVRNDDPTKWYDDISVGATDGAEDKLVTGGLGFSVKLQVGNKRPTHEEWNLIQPGSTVDFSDAIGSSVNGDITVYLPFWVRIQIPGNQPATVIKDLCIVVSATEHLI